MSCTSGLFALSNLSVGVMKYLTELAQRVLWGFEGPYSKLPLLTNVMTSLLGQAEDMHGLTYECTAGLEGRRDIYAGRRCEGLQGNRVSRVSELINYGKTRMSLQVPELYRCREQRRIRNLNTLNKYASKLVRVCLCHTQSFESCVL